jgi:uncharacterized OB-fold protein
MEHREFEARGVVYAFTTVHVGPVQFSPPYSVAYVDLVDGPRIFAHLVTTAGLRPNDRVEGYVVPVAEDDQGTRISAFAFRRTDS